MRRYALLLLIVAGLLVTPAAVGVPDDPGDETPPEVTLIIFGTLGLNGWYVTNVTVNWSVVDDESIILDSEGCDATTLTADTLGTPLTCWAESDGGETTVSKTFKIDKTVPTASANPARAADANGWYNHSVGVSFTGSDAMSGLDFCSSPQTYGGPDSSSATVTGSCSDVAGNSKSASLGLKYDATAPQASTAPARAPDSNGWYNHPLAVGFTGSDVTSGLDSCTAPQTYTGPDGSGAVAGSCRDWAGNVAGRSFTLAYDATAPVVRPSPARTADANGWYNRPLTISFGGSDATSGIEACASVPYAGPDDASAAVSGTCRDRAGNAGAGPFTFKYDATPPAVSSVRAKPGNRSLELTWDVSADARVVEVIRAPGVNGAATTLVYRGSGGKHRDVGLGAGRTYRYTVAAYDEAVNRGARSAKVVATGPLLAPAPGARVSSPPRLVWTPVKGATYYNVQLIRERGILSTWPVRPSLQLKRTWISKGRRYRLKPGVYRWYVWPGYGRPTEGRYGKRIGGSSFVVVG